MAGPAQRCQCVPHDWDAVPSDAGLHLGAQLGLPQHSCELACLNWAESLQPAVANVGSLRADGAEQWLTACLISARIGDETRSQEKYWTRQSIRLQILSSKCTPAGKGGGLHRQLSILNSTFPSGLKQGKLWAMRVLMHKYCSCQA